MADVIIVTGLVEESEQRPRSLPRSAVLCLHQLSRQSGGGDGVVRAIEAAGGRAIGVAADVSSEADVERLFEHAIEI